MILEAIGKAIEKAKVTRYRIAQDTGIDEAILHRLVNGGSCSMQTAEILCEYLDLELKPKRRKGKK